MFKIHFKKLFKNLFERIFVFILSEISFSCTFRGHFILNGQSGKLQVYLNKLFDCCGCLGRKKIFLEIPIKTVIEYMC